MSNNIYIKLINWSDEEIKKLSKFLDDTNVNWAMLNNLEHEHPT